MPVYDYNCSSCGPFCELQTLEEALSPVPCPKCHSLSARAFNTMPRVNAISAGNRDAHEANERAREAPHSVDGWKEASARRTHGRHEHGPGCGCGSKSATTHKTKTLVMPDGSKSFPGQRPWMISH